MCISNKAERAFLYVLMKRTAPFHINYDKEKPKHRQPQNKRANPRFVCGMSRISEALCHPLNSYQSPYSRAEGLCNTEAKPSTILSHISST